MRTTVTLDPDVVKMLEEAMHARRASFKETVNAALRAGLRKKRAQGGDLELKAYPLKLRSGIDELSMNRLLDEMETDEVARKLES